ncbi:MAG: NifU family protein [Nocardioidaceae bacterium]|nr:NifU family protein [Nocardioidaceae bacterium]
MTAAASAPETPEADPIEALAGRLDAAMARVADLDAPARELVDELLASLNDLHKQGLTSVVRGLRDDPRGKELLFDLVDDPAVHMVLAMHGIIRPDPLTLAQRAIAQVRPGINSHGGDVELVGIDGTVAHVRLTGACQGCSMAAVTLRDSVEEALLRGVPGLTGVEVVPNEPTPTLIPVSEIRRRPDDASEAAQLAAAGWTRALGVGDIPVGSTRSVRAGEGSRALDVLLVNVGGQVSAYENACAHQGLPLDDAELDPVAGTLTCPWHGFCYDATSGECVTMPGAQLATLPVRLAGGDVWVRADG